MSNQNNDQKRYIFVDRNGEPTRFLVLAIGSGVIGFIVLVIFAWLFFAPMYGVYKATKAGEAELAQAKSNRQIRITESEALVKAAENEAAANVTRAEGQAKAIELVKAAMQGADQTVLAGLWLNVYEETARTGISREIIYLPTDLNAPGLLPTWFTSGIQPIQPTELSKRSEPAR